MQSSGKRLDKNEEAKKKRQASNGGEGDLSPAVLTGEGT